MWGGSDSESTPKKSRVDGGRVVDAGFPLDPSRAQKIPRILGAFSPEGYPFAPPEDFEVDGGGRGSKRGGRFLYEGYERGGARPREVGPPVLGRRRGEVKYSHHEAGVSPVANTGEFFDFGGGHCIGAVPIGVGAGERIGTKIGVFRLIGNGQVAFTTLGHKSVSGVYGSGMHLRFCAVRDRAFRGILPSPYQVFGNGNGSTATDGYSLRNPDEMDRFDILYEKWFHCPPIGMNPSVLVTQSGVVGDPIVSTLESNPYSYAMPLFFDIDCDIPLAFNDTGFATDADLVGQGIFLLGYGVTQLPDIESVDVSVRVRCVYGDC